MDELLLSAWSCDEGEEEEELLALMSKRGGFGSLRGEEVYHETIIYLHQTT